MSFFNLSFPKIKKKTNLGDEQPDQNDAMNTENETVYFSPDQTIEPITNETINSEMESVVVDSERNNFQVELESDMTSVQERISFEFSKYSFNF